MEEEEEAPTPAPTPQPAPQPQQPTGPQGNGSIDIGDVVTFNSGRYYATSYGEGSSGAAYQGQQVRVNHLNWNGSHPIHIQTLGGGDLGWLKQSQISGYDTGGYTGT